MTSSFEKEKNKLLQEKCQAALTELLKDDDNKYCVDCDTKGPRWSSWNIGIFVCIRCAGIHRNLGVHISRVKSVNLDTWTPQQVACIQQMGNSRARAVYEANLPDNFRRPQTDSSLEQFIRAKYEAKKYIAREWVQPEIVDPKWEELIEKQLKNKKKEKKSLASGIELPAPVSCINISKMNGASPKPLPRAPVSTRTPPTVHNSSLSQSSANTTQTPVSTIAVSTSGSASIDLLGLDVPKQAGSKVESCDPFGEFLSASVVASSENSVPNSASVDAATKQEEENFFNQKAPDNEKLTKDSILALYGKTAPGRGSGGECLGQPLMQQAMANPLLQMSSHQINPHMNPQMQQPGIVQQKGQFICQQLNGVSQPPNMLFMQQQMMCGTNMMPGQMIRPQLQTTNIQLSAANPFAQMQAQMGGVSGPLVGLHTQLGNLQLSAQPAMMGQQQQFQMSAPFPGMMSGAALQAQSQPASATPAVISTNLWQ